MRLLSKSARGGKNVTRIEAGLERELEADGSDRLVEATQAIGLRYESIHGGLDGIERVMEHLRSIEPLLAEVRKPVTEEFEARRAEHAELLSLRTAHDGALDSIDDLQSRERDLSARLAGAEANFGESEAIRQSQESQLEENALELDRLRNQLLQTELRAGSLDASLRDVSARAEHLDQDCAALRSQAQESELRRNEAENALARATQDFSLASEENGVLKKRLDYANGEVARLARVETELETQIASERARNLADQTEATRNIRSLEGQVEAARSDAAALQARFETAVVRAEKLEELNTQLSQRLGEIGAAHQAAERRASELQVSVDRAQERIRSLEEEADALRHRHASLDTARAAAIERADQLAKTVQAQEKALKRGEERAAQLRARFETLQAAQDQAQREHAERATEMQSELERIRAEAAVNSGALESARRDRARLQMALLGGGDQDDDRAAG